MRALAIAARQIQLLREASSQLDNQLIYVADHGESLGENGIYLHDMPHAFAPAVQKEIPCLLGAAELRNQVYHRNLDPLAGGRRGGGHE